MRRGGLSGLVRLHCSSVGRGTRRRERVATHLHHSPRSGESDHRRVGIVIERGEAPAEAAKVPQAPREHFPVFRDGDRVAAPARDGCDALVVDTAPGDLLGQDLRPLVAVAQLAAEPVPPAVYVAVARDDGAVEFPGRNADAPDPRQALDVPGTEHVGELPGGGIPVSEGAVLSGTERQDPTGAGEQKGVRDADQTAAGGHLHDTDAVSDPTHEHSGPAFVLAPAVAQLPATE